MVVARPMYCRAKDALTASGRMAGFVGSTARMALISEVK
jgi:hypothetical protein